MDLKSATLYWMILAICLAFLGGWLCHDWVTDSSVEVQVSQGALSVAEIAVPSDEVIATEDSASLVNINTASEEELQTLPSIGTVRAQSIIAYRETNGLFTYPEELTQVEGIGEGILEEILPYITTE